MTSTSTLCYCFSENITHESQMSLTLQVSVSDVNVHSESILEQAQTDGRTNSGLNCQDGPRPAEDTLAVRIPAAAELETPPGDKIDVHVNKAATKGVTSLHRKFFR